MSKAINLSRNNQLCCPVCGESNLHQYRCEVYWRDAEDSNTGIKIVSEESGIFVASKDMKKNPSSRRDGIRIDFWCEECCGLDQADSENSNLSLLIYQHKGTTFLEWDLD